MTSKLDNRPITALIAARCRMLGFSHRTIDSYAGRLAAFEDWSGVPAMEADQELAAAWLVAASPSRHSVYHNRCALVFLFQRLRDEPIDPAVLPPIRAPKPTTKIVADPWQLANLFAAIGNPRYRIFCQFLYATGLRLEEALAVRVDDLDWTDRSVVVRLGKGRRSRRSILPEAMIALLRGYRATWAPASLLFTADGSAHDRPLHPERINDALAVARRRTGLACPVTAHFLRHCFATHLHERGVGLVELQRLLGHSSVFSTLHYIGMREARRREIAVVGDLLAALPAPRMEQQRIAFAGWTPAGEAEVLHSSRPLV